MDVCNTKDWIFGNPEKDYTGYVAQIFEKNNQLVVSIIMKTHKVRFME